MKHWLVKSEPFKYSWDQFLKDKKTFWDGVRNYQARNNLKAMKKGDLVMFYHSNEGKHVVDLAPFKTLKKPVTLEDIKADDKLRNIALVKQGRLSVMPLNGSEFDRIIEMSEE
jgi:predicted RNA-binding protein with PUA-like domain